MSKCFELFELLTVQQLILHVSHVKYVQMLECKFYVGMTCLLYKTWFAW